MSAVVLTDRQRRELEYHKGHAALQIPDPIKFDVLYSPNRRWWNAHWDLWTYAFATNSVRKIIYGNEKPYITQDERKMTEVDIGHVKNSLASIAREKYFNFLVTRLISNSKISASKFDRMLLALVGKWGGRLVAGRILLAETMPSQ